MPERSVRHTYICGCGRFEYPIFTWQLEKVGERPENLGQKHVLESDRAPPLDCHNLQIYRSTSRQLCVDATTSTGTILWPVSSDSSGNIPRSLSPKHAVRCFYYSKAITCFTRAWKRPASRQKGKKQSKNWSTPSRVLSAKDRVHTTPENPLILPSNSRAAKSPHSSECASQHEHFIFIAHSPGHQDIQDIPSSEGTGVTMQLYEIPAPSFPVHQVDTFPVIQVDTFPVQVDAFEEHDRTQVRLTKHINELSHSRWPARNNIPPTERVSKPIRMRIRYTCHRCKTSFGHDKECNSCRHRRCARCDRHPSRKVKPTPDVQDTTSTPVAHVKEALPAASEPVVLDSFCTCHECQTVLEVEVQECPSCQHTICEKCHTEARLQSLDTFHGVLISSTEEERISQPEEQKLPPDSTAAEEEQPTMSR